MADAAAPGALAVPGVAVAAPAVRPGSTRDVQEPAKVAGVDLDRLSNVRVPLTVQFMSAPGMAAVNASWTPDQDYWLRGYTISCGWNGFVGPGAVLYAAFGWRLGSGALVPITKDGVIDCLWIADKPQNKTGPAITDHDSVLLPVGRPVEFFSLNNLAPGPAVGMLSFTLHVVPRAERGKL